MVGRTLVDPYPKVRDKPPPRPESQELMDPITFLRQHKYAFIEPRNPFDRSGRANDSLLVFLGLNRPQWDRLSSRFKAIADSALARRIEGLQRVDSGNSVAAVSLADPAFGRELEKRFREALRNALDEPSADFVLDTAWGRQWLSAATDNLSTESVAYTLKPGGSELLPLNSLVVTRNRDNESPRVSVYHFGDKSELSDPHLTRILKQIEALGHVGP